MREDHRQDVRGIALKLLEEDAEVWSGDVVDAWPESPYPRRHTAVTFVGHVLRRMEVDGELASRLVPPSEHRGSQLARRYYRRAE